MSKECIETNFNPNICPKYEKMLTSEGLAIKEKVVKTTILDDQPKYEKHLIEVSVEENINVKPI